MKSLILSDRRGNGSSYAFLLPDKMERWRVSSFLEYMRTDHGQMEQEGYLAAAIDPIRRESLRQLIETPAATLNRPVQFLQDDCVLGVDDAFSLKDRENVVILDRVSDEPVRLEEAGVSVARRNREAFSSCRTEITTVIDDLFDFESHSIRLRKGPAVTSFSDVVDGFTEVLDETNQLRVMYRLAEVLHAAPFENISKILDNVGFRPGYELWANLARGYGGICAEKTGALNFICDTLDLQHRPVLGSVSPIPKDYAGQLERYVESGGEAELPVWIQHLMLQVDVGGETCLVDATNGNVPFMFLDEADTERLLAGGIRTRMVYNSERLNLARSDEVTGDLLLTLSEFHVPELHMEYIFGQGLGLQISPDLFLGVYFDWGGEVSARQQEHYSSLARRVRFPYPRFIHAANLKSVPDEGMRDLLNALLQALHRHFRDPNYTGDFTFVIQPLHSHFWAMPRVSRSLRACLGEFAEGVSS